MIVSPLVWSEVRGRTVVAGSSEHVRTKWEDVQYGNQAQALPSELKESILLTVQLAELSVLPGGRLSLASRNAALRRGQSVAHHYIKFLLSRKPVFIQQFGASAVIPKQQKQYKVVFSCQLDPLISEQPPWPAV